MMSAPPPWGRVLLPLSPLNAPAVFWISEPDEVISRRSRVPLPDPTAFWGMGTISLVVMSVARVLVPITTVVARATVSAPRKLKEVMQHRVELDVVLMS